jgi:carboxysome shell carbonic anhydrase
MKTAGSRIPRPGRTPLRGWQVGVAYPRAQQPAAPRGVRALSPLPAAGGTHPLCAAALSAALRERAQQIESAFARIDPLVEDLATHQFEPGFAERAADQVHRSLGITLPPALFRSSWAAPLDARRLHASCVTGTFCRLIGQEYDDRHASHSDGESAEELIRRWGFHAIDITPCADGRLSGVVDYILRVPQAVVAYRKSYAGALFDVEESVRHWEAVELRRWRDGIPNAASEPTRYLKIGVYHFSSIDPAHEGCAAHGSDGGRAAAAVLERLTQFAGGLTRTHSAGAAASILLVGVDTDTDAIRVHVPAADGGIAVERYVDNLALYQQTLGETREGAKQQIRSAVAACAGVGIEDAATEGMRWFCGYLLKNNIGQIDAVVAWHGGSYADRGHTERLIVVGDAVDDVQLRNLAFQAQMETVEEGAGDLDVGIRILRRLQEPRALAIPVLVHERYDARIPGARERARCRALRLQAAIEARYRDLPPGLLFVQSIVRDGAGCDPEVVTRENAT